MPLNTTRQDKIKSLDSSNGEQNSIPCKTEQIEALAGKLSTGSVEPEQELNNARKPEVEQADSRE